MLILNWGSEGNCGGQWGGGDGKGEGELKNAVFYDRIEPHNKVQV